MTGWTMRMLQAGLMVLAAVLTSAPAHGAPTRSSPIAVVSGGGGDDVFVVNPDQDTLARLTYNGSRVGTLAQEKAVGDYPRTLTLAGGFVFTADQNSDTVSRVSQSDLGGLVQKNLGAGCNPYGVVATPDHSQILVTCQGSSELVFLDLQLNETARVKLDFPNARGIAISDRTSDAGLAYVTHFLTEEPGMDGHVSVIDMAQHSISKVILIPGDVSTCETQNSGQGALNLVSAIALVPDGAPSEVAGQLWVGGTQENNITKGLFKRWAAFKDEAGADMFPLLQFAPFPRGSGNRNIYKASFHDITRLGIWKLDPVAGTQVGKLDFDEANNATDIEFSTDGTTAYVVDLTFNSFHILNTKKGQGADVTTLFAGPSAYGPGGADPTKQCDGQALAGIVGEQPFRMAPQAQITTIDGYDPVDQSYTVVSTGVEFDARAFQESGGVTNQMKPVADGIGTAPIGVRLSSDGQAVFVANYLARNVMVAASAVPLAGNGKPANLRCTTDIAGTNCGTNNDCSGGGFCNHPGGAACQVDADCGTNPPCVRATECVPLMLGQPVSSITGGLANDALQPSLLDGKILFNTAARDGSIRNGVGLGSASPLYNFPRLACHQDELKSCGTSRGASAFVCSFCSTTTGQQCDADADCPGGERCVVDIRFCSGDRTKVCRSDADCPGNTGPCGDDNATFCSNDPAHTCASDADCGGGTCKSARCDVVKSLPGEIVSTSHDASYVTCTSCHADFGGQDGRTWDFSQFGSSLRNTMDLRGRAGYAPGRCDSASSSTECTFDNDPACGPGQHTCKPLDANVPPNVTGEARTRWFNPMMTIHWNGDRDEVEDFEHTFRSLQGSGDCDGAEHSQDVCEGALLPRNPKVTSDCLEDDMLCSNSLTTSCHVDADCPTGGKCSVFNCEDIPFDELQGSARNFPRRDHGNPSVVRNVGIRLTHMADFVYSLTKFPKNPNVTTEASERGRQLFNDPQIQCAACHIGGPGAGRQFFSDKKPNPSFAAGQPARMDQNNPFVRHDVGTANLFDKADPNQIASDNQSFQDRDTNPSTPAPRGTLGDYVTPVLNDAWNTAPYLHDGSAHTLLDVIRPCDSTTDDCSAAAHGRNVDGQHGVTAMLTPSQLNDLVVFMKTLTLSTVIGTNAQAVSFGSLDLSSAVVGLPKTTKRGKHLPGTLKMSGRLFGAPGAIDPSAGVSLEIGVPDGDQMVSVSATFTMRGKGKSFHGRAHVGDSSYALTLKGARGGFRFQVVGRKLDLTAFDTGNTDVTVGFVVSNTNFVKDRTLKANKSVLKLPKGRA